MAATIRPGDAGRAGLRVRGRGPTRGGTDRAAPRAPEWPGAVAGCGGRRRPGARIERRSDEPGAPARRHPDPHPGYTNAVAGATALNVAGGMSSLAGTLA